MQILPISNYTPIRQNQRTSDRTINPNFGHHPDFIELRKEYEICASSYFRRGCFYGSPCVGFVDVINALKKFFNKEMINFPNSKKRMLIGGIGDSQEPFSLLAVIKSLIGETPLEQVLDMGVIDLQSKPTESELLYQSFYDILWDRPKYVPESFEKETTTRYGLSREGKYKVCDDIFNYLSSVYNNPQKAQWETRIQEAVKEYPDSSFDIISINNTIGYLNSYNEGIQVLKDVFRILKPGGIFITDPDYRKFKEVFKPEISDEIYPGIYQKKQGLFV